MNGLRSSRPIYKVLSASVLASLLLAGMSPQGDSTARAQAAVTAATRILPFQSNMRAPSSTSPGVDQVPPPFHPELSHKPVCPNDRKPGTARCNSEVVTDAAGNPLVTTSSPLMSPNLIYGAYGPTEFRGAYGLTGISSTNRIVGIVDAYDDPTVLNDLDVYSDTAGIPRLNRCAVSTGTAAHPCIQKVDQNGGTTYPSGTSWADEIALDVEAVHALCQNCNILLVEASSSSSGNLLTANDRARLMGANVISNSWGSTTGEFVGETTLDSYFDHAGVAYVFSSGDSGYGPQYPAASPFVTAVGGTTLIVNADGSYNSETAWSGAGSGCSAYEAKPSFQHDAACPTHRTIADVSADADPSTGAAIYLTTPSPGGWYRIGGTSLAAPLVAAVYALAGGVGSTRGNSLPYANLNYGVNLRDVISGSNGSCGGSLLCTALTGYDGPTGLGTPKGFDAFAAYTLSVSKSGTGSGTVTSSPTGINCGSTCSYDFNYNTPVTLTAVASTGSTFSGWGGACSGTGTCSVTMTAAASVTANFTLNTYTLSVSNTGTGSGTVTSSPTGINCGATCSYDFDYNTPVTLTAVASTGSTFTGWSGACTGTGTCNVTMTAARSVTANFALNTYTLSVSKNGTGSGTVTSSPTGINCGSTCSYAFDYNTPVTLTAAAATGSTFSGWSGACTGTGTCSVTMTAARSVTASFALNTYTLSVSKTGAGSGTVTSSPTGINCGSTCSYDFSYNTPVTLTAVASTGSTFTGWSGACTGTGTCSVTMTAAASVTANFTLNTYTLSVSKTGTGNGTVTSSPTGINCGSTCSYDFNYNTPVTLTAVASTGSTFSGWGGACSGMGTCSVTMTAARSVAASFALNTYTLSVSKNGTGSGTVTSVPTGINCGATCSYAFAYNTPITLTATPTSPATFGGWSGACTGTGTCSVTMSAAQSVTATFNLPGSQTLTVTKAGTGSGTVTSTPTGINCGSTCSYDFNYNTPVTLTAVASTGSTFTGWSGACTGTGTCNVTMTAAASVMASFSLNTYTLSVSKNGSGSGTVTSDPAGIDCGATCSYAFDYNTPVTLTAAAATGSTFSGWSGACTGSGTCSVTITQARSVTAGFALNTYTLSVIKSGAGSGTVTSLPTGINCGGTCSYAFNSNTPVTLTAVASTGSAVTGWSGAGCTGTTTCSVTMTANTTVTASFSILPEPYEATLYTITNQNTLRTVDQTTAQTTVIAELGTGGIHALSNRPGDTTYIYGLAYTRLDRINTVAGQAAPLPEFDEATLGISSPLAFAIAISPAAPNVAVITGMDGISGDCYVWKADVDTGLVLGPAIPTAGQILQLAYGPDGSILYGTVGSGQLVSVNGDTGSTALIGDPGLNDALEGLAFRPSDGALFGVTWDQHSLVRLDPANASLMQTVGDLGSGFPVGLAFVRSDELSITRIGAGTGTVTSNPVGINCGPTCSASFNHNSLVTLSAAPSIGSIFAGWSGSGCAGTDNCSVTMTAAQAVTANFSAETHTLSVGKAGTGSGTVTSSPPGIDCGSACSLAFAYNTPITLTAAAATGSAFSGWSGAGCSGTTSCSVTMIADATVTASFSILPDPYEATLYMTENQGTLRSVNPATADTTVVGNLGTQSILGLSNHPGDTMYIYGVESNRLVRIDTVTGDTTLLPVFDESTLGISSIAADAVAISPTAPNIAVIAGMSLDNGTHFYIWKADVDTGVVLGAAVPTTERLYELAYSLDGSVLYGAEGKTDLATVDSNTGNTTLIGRTGLGNPLEGMAFRPDDGELFGIVGYEQRLVRVDPANGSVIEPIGALGVAGPYGLAFVRSDQLSITRMGTGTGTVTSNPPGINCGPTCSQSFPHNSSVTLTAAAAGGSTFGGWSGAGCSGTGTCSVTMTAAASVTANFGPAMPPAQTHPSNGAQVCRRQQVGVDLSVTALMRNAGGSFDPSKVALKLDGVPVTGAATIQELMVYPSSHVTILYTPTSDLALGSHQAQFTFPIEGGTHMLQWGFTATSMACGATVPNATTGLDSNTHPPVTGEQANQQFSTNRSPEIAAVYPAQGSQACLQPSVGVALRLTDLLRQKGSFDPSTVVLKLDGTDVTGSAVITQNETYPVGEATLQYTPTADLAMGDHQASLTYAAPSGQTTVSWGFTITAMECAAPGDVPYSPSAPVEKQAP